MKIKIILLMLVFTADSLLAQVMLSGKIVDSQSKESLPGASIVLKPSNNGVISSADGTFLFQALQKGKKAIEVRFLGYQKTNFEIQLNNDTTMLIMMEPQTFMSEEVVVKSSRVSADNPITFSVLTKGEIQSKNQGTDLPYLLQTSPSVVVSSDAGAGIGYTNLRIRGTDLTRINVTLNGVPVNDPESHGVFFVNLPDLSSSVENIQIQRGVGTSNNGAAAFGASLNIQTSDRAEHAFATITSSIGSFNSLKHGLSFGTGIGNNGFSLDGRLSKITSDGFVERGASDLKSYFLAVNWANSRNIVKLIATSGKEKTYQSWYGIPKDSLKSNRRYNPAGAILDDDGQISGYYPNQTDNYQQDYYQLHAARELNKQFTLSASLFLTKGKGYYESWKNDEDLKDYGFSFGGTGSQTIETTDLVQQKWLDNQFYGGQVSLNHTIKNLQNTFGIGWNRYVGDHFGFISWAQYAGNSTNDSPWYMNTGDKSDLNIFAKSDYSLSGKMQLFVDLQYRHIYYSIEGVHEDLADFTQQHRFDFFNPKAGLNYRISKNLNLYGSFAISNREPNRSVYRDADPGQVIKAEKLLNYEAGIRFRNERVTIGSNLFMMDYTDQLVLTGKINNVGAAIMTNVKDSYRAGWESSMQIAFSSDFSLMTNLTLSLNKINNFTEYVDNWNYWDDPENEPYQYTFERGNTHISFSPSVLAFAGLNWKPTESLTINYSSQFVGRQFIDNTSDINRSLEPYHLGNLSIDYTIKQKLFKQALIRLYLNNLFNASYETNAWVYRYYYNGEAYQMDGYFPQAGFHWMAQITLCM